jgi:hypothetical protein
MTRNLRLLLLGSLALLLGLMVPISLVSGQEKVAVPPSSSLNITVTAGTAPPPLATLTLLERHGHVTPSKGKCAHTGGGLIDVASPSPDTIIITMNGAAVANASMHFDVDQCFEVALDPKVKKATLTVEGRVIGLLRGGHKGCAEYSDACAHISAGPVNILSVCVPPHSVCGCDSLSVNDHDGPKTIPVVAGKYTLSQTFAVSAQTSSFFCKRPSAEFAPDPALDPLWISYWEPFHGVKKDTFGFQLIIRVADATETK